MREALAVMGRRNVRPAPTFGKSGVAVHIGDLFCGDVDIDAWKQKHRAPMYPGQWNRWILKRTTRDNPSALDIRDTAFAVMRKWFETVQARGEYLDFPIPGRPGVSAEAGDIDHLKVVTHGPLSTLLPKLKRSGLSLVKEGPINEITVVEPATYVFVEFVYRGMLKDMPWPVHREGFYNTWCPIDADWALIGVLSPKSTGCLVGRHRG